ncbi:MAG: RNA methyltransferase [Rhodoluna sp.]|nr:RNA methyltransferase [Rhodoluna sp.]
MLIDPKANKVRGVAKLTKKDARSSTGLFLLEGPQGLKEALNRPKLIVELFATEDAVERYPDLFERAESSRIVVQMVSEPVLKALTDTTTPQGIVAVCEQLHTGLDDIIAAKPRLVALLANIRDPGNAGTVLRAADAAGADAVIFSTNSVDVYNPKVVRSTTGSVFHVPFAIDVPIEDAIAALKSAGLQVFAANGGGVEIPSLGDEVLAKPTAWVFGNEAWGFEQSTLDLVDQEVAVPLYGAAESLNLATAASICLYVTAFAQNKA